MVRVGHRHPDGLPGSVQQATQDIGECVVSHPAGGMPLRDAKEGQVAVEGDGQVSDPPCTLALERA
jgi:hypothetical protein